MKPDWNEAPEWAKWASQNEYGEWWWFEFEPHPGNASWRATGRYIRCVTPRKDWRETLEQRPE